MNPRTRAAGHSMAPSEAALPLSITAFAHELIDFALSVALLRDQLLSCHVPNSS